MKLILVFLVFVFSSLSQAEIQSNYVKTNGIYIHYLSTGDSDGELVLFLHGFPEFSDSWKHYLTGLAKVDPTKHYVAMDMRGYGQSSVPTYGCNTHSHLPCFHYTLDKVIHDVVGVINQLTDKPAYLVAHDWGAGIANPVTIQYPDLVKKLIILNGTHAYMYYKEYLDFTSDQFRRAYYIRDFNSGYMTAKMYLKDNAKILRDVMFRTPFFDPETQAKYLMQWHSPHRMWAQIQYYQNIQTPESLFLKPEPFLNELKKLTIDTPTVLIWGLLDPYFSLDVLNHKDTAYSNLKFYPLGANGHFVQHENFPAVFSILQKELN